ncbi:diaminopimelate epimerase [Ruminococcus sp.]|uniref:diaminopimelate epimerase n=1 Tax=Ruminococcus sp. TaxID=41978 RepID=UPI0025EFB84E|nr:diaminopimelate epimerase [Ruminococcus sp.]MBQ6035616.1 diaminopimelate epimerase [Ruminococcus sp.]MBQ6252660.1 diaminopimelate epimerase [Ruminococcus sp.]
MRFTKMQGCGNDYIYVNCFEESVTSPQQLAKTISDRHFGIGSDGLVLIMPSETADCRMRMFNSDGSESEMCGNAIRCVAKYVYDRDIIHKRELSVETLAGIKYITINTDDNDMARTMTVDMGAPITEASDIPVFADRSPVTNMKLSAFGREFTFTCVSMGNPHAVTFIDEAVMGFDVERFGKVFEVDKHFPRRSNIEFAEVISSTHLKMRVWERGAGETLACGTGTCATVAAACLNGICPREPVTVDLLGGQLIIEWKETDGHIYMTGPAEFVFDGEI